MYNFLCLNRDLLCKLTGRGDDKGTNVTGTSAVASTVLEVRISQDALNDGHQESNGLARACFGLCDHIGAIKTLVDGQSLHLSHGVNAHSVDNRADDLGADEAIVGKLLKL